MNNFEESDTQISQNVFRPGKVIDKYKVIEFVDDQSTGTLYKAFQEEPVKRFVDIKILGDKNKVGL